MKPAIKLAAFGLVLGLAFAGGAAVGEAVGPVDTGDTETHHDQAPPTTSPGPAPTTTVHEGGHQP